MSYTMHDSVQTITAVALHIPVLKYTSKEGLELLRLLTINGVLLHKKMCVAGSRIALCNTSHEALCVVSSMCDYSLMYGWAMETSVSIV